MSMSFKYFFFSINLISQSVFAFNLARFAAKAHSASKVFIFIGDIADDQGMTSFLYDFFSIFFRKFLKEFFARGLLDP